MIEVNIENIDFMPLLKQQLKNYIGINYEEAGDYSNISLVREYYFLKNNSRLEDLFEAEYLTDELRLQRDFG